MSGGGEEEEKRRRSSERGVEKKKCEKEEMRRRRVFTTRFYNETMTLEITRITEQKLKICVSEINEKNNTEPN